MRQVGTEQGKMLGESCRRPSEYRTGGGWTAGRGVGMGDEGLDAGGMAVGAEAWGGRFGGVGRGRRRCVGMNGE